MPTCKMIQIISHSGGLFALCEDGSLWGIKDSGFIRIAWFDQDLLRYRICDLFDENTDENVEQ